jgi:hypothetical protein
MVHSSFQHGHRITFVASLRAVYDSSTVVLLPSDPILTAASATGVFTRIINALEPPSFEAVRNRSALLNVNMKGGVTQTVFVVETHRKKKLCQRVVENLEADFPCLKPSKPTIHRPVNRLRATGSL